MQESAKTLEAIKHSILEVIPPPEGVRLLKAAAQELVAEGRPIPPSRMRELGGEVGLPVAAVDEMADAFTEDDDGHVTGVAGLTVVNSPHHFHVGEQDLHTWCGLDALVFPPFLQLPGARRS